MQSSPEEISVEFPFDSNYITVMGSTIHYIEEGSGDPVLFLHGNPTSSYLWRNIIPHLSKHARCIAPDLIGMGQSAKPDLAYGFRDSYAYLEAFIEQMNLKHITLVIHDWGSGLGFHYANTHRDNVKGIAFMEAIYRLLDWDTLPLRLKVGMRMMRNPLINWLMLGVANFFIRKVLPNGTIRQLSPTEKQVYASPFPTVTSRKPVRVWPTEIALKGSPPYTHKVISEYHKWLKESEVPKLCFHADPGMLIPKEEVAWIKEHFPNTTLVDIGKGLHFVQEDNPHAIGRGLAKWYQAL
ncbi:MAG: haloalkane dehalogenase [Bacteroidota bacterium]